MVILDLSSSEQDTPATSFTLEVSVDTHSLRVSHDHLQLLAKMQVLWEARTVVRSDALCAWDFKW